MDRADLKSKIERFIASENSDEALVELKLFWQAERTSSAASWVLRRFDRIRHSLSNPLVKMKVAILRSFTVEPLLPLLQAESLLYNIDLTVQAGGYNTYAQEILDGESSLYQFKPDVVILAVDARDLKPDPALLADSSAPEALAACVEENINKLRALVQSLREKSPAFIIMHTLDVPPYPEIDFSNPCSLQKLTEAIGSINAGLRKCCTEIQGAYALAYDRVVAAYEARHGACSWHDSDKWKAYKTPFQSSAALKMVQEWLRMIVPLAGKTCKVLVVDLDSTLWGGTVGEDGLGGLVLGDDSPLGLAHTELQRALLQVVDRGILLAVASKNNWEDAIEVIENHPSMLLRRDKFAALRINWSSKHLSLLEIAAELNVGTDALAFLDNDPVERDAMQHLLPEATVIELPDQPELYAEAVLSSPVLERLSLTEEDIQRSRYYQEDRQRKDLEASSTSLSEFLHSLEIKVDCLQVGSGGAGENSSITRIAQLTQKTNQFNMTTVRMTEQEVLAALDRENWNVYQVRSSDRFGDNGLVGVVMTEDEGAGTEIKNLLLSCRVIGRGIESALLASVVEQCRRRGMQSVSGWFLPTKRNAPAGDLYLKHGFAKIEETSQGTLWKLVINGAHAPVIPVPDWIELNDDTRNT